MSKELLKLDDKALIKEMFKIKYLTTPEKLCKGLNDEFVQYMKYIRNLEFEEDPDYNYLKGLFISILTKNEQKNDLLFSWVINKRKKEKDNSNDNKSYNLKRKMSVQKRLYNQIKKSLEKSKSMNKITDNRLINNKEDNNILNNIYINNNNISKNEDYNIRIIKENSAISKSNEENDFTKAKIIFFP